MVAGRAPGVFGQLKVDVGFATLSTTNPLCFPAGLLGPGRLLGGGDLS